MSTLLRKSWRDLLKGRWQALGIALLVAIVTILIVGGMHTRALLQHTVDGWYERLGMADLEIVCFPTHRGAIDYAQEVEGIAAMEERLLVEGLLAGRSIRPVPALVRILPEDARPKIDRLELLDGRLPKPGEKAVVVDRSVVHEYGLGIGDSVSLEVAEHKGEYPIVGVALSPEHVLHPVHPEYTLPLKGTVAVLYASAATTEGVEHAERINSILFLFEEGADAEAIKTELLRVLPVSVSHVKPRETEPGRVFTGMIVKTFDIYMPSVAAMCVLIALTLLVLTCVRMVKRQEKTIGTLLAIGHRPHQIALSYVALAVVPTAVGALLGAVLQRPFALHLFDGYASSVGFAPPIDPGSGLELPLTIIGCLLVALLACTLPALWMARSRPAALLRPVILRRQRRRQNVVVHTVARLRDVLRLPISVVLGMTNIARRRWATTSAVLGLGGIFALVLAFLMVHVTHRVELERSVERMGLDATVVFRKPAYPDAVEALGAAVDGVAEPIVAKIALFEIGDRSLFRRLTGAPPGRWTGQLSLAEGRVFTDPWANEIVIDRWLADETGLAVGDAVSLYPFPNAPEGFELTLVGILDGVSLGSAVVPIEIARQLFGLPDQATAAQIATDMSGTTLESRLWAQAGVESVFDMQRAQSRVTGNFEGSESVLLFGLFMAIGIAVLFLAILAGLDAVDRAPDLAVLQAVGWRDRAVLGLCLTEVLTRGLLALVIALPLAPVLANWLLDRISAANHYRMTLETPSWLSLSLVGLALALIPLGAIPAYRASRQVTPARAMRMLTRE